MVQKQFKTLHIGERVGEKVQRNTSDKFKASDRAVNKLSSTILTTPEENNPIKRLEKKITETITAGNSLTISSFTITPRGGQVELYFIPGVSARFETGSNCTMELYRQEGNNDEVLVSSVNLTTAMRRMIKEISLVDYKSISRQVTYSFKVVSTTGSVTIENIYALIREL